MAVAPDTKSSPEDAIILDIGPDSLAISRICSFYRRPEDEQKSASNASKCKSYGFGMSVLDPFPKARKARSSANIKCHNITASLQKDVHDK
jgi:hypothetical protein